MFLIKNNWTKWEHIRFYFISGYGTYDILQKTNTKTGLKKYKSILVAECYMRKVYEDE